MSYWEDDGEGCFNEAGAKRPGKPSLSVIDSCSAGASMRPGQNAPENIVENGMLMAIRVKLQ